jgi:hypothetical protein
MVFEHERESDSQWAAITRTAEPFPPALLEKRPPASVLSRIHHHKTHQRQRVTH